MSRIFRSIVCSLLAVSLMVTPALTQNIAEIRTAAKSAFRVGNYDEAAKLYQQLVSLNPSKLNVLKEAMWAYWNMGKISEAQNLAGDVTKISPEDAEAQKILGWAPTALNRKKITDLHTKAKAAYQRGDYDEAADLFAQITTLDPQNVTMLRDRMWILWNMKRTGESARIAERILRLRPGDADAQSILDRAPNATSKVSRNTPASQEMITDLQEKVLANPNNATAVRQLAWSLFNSGRGAEAEARLRAFLNLNPEYPEMWVQLGKIQQVRQKDKASNESFQKSLDYDPNQPQLLSALGRKAFGDRNLDEAIRNFERAVTLENEESRDLLPILGKALFYRGEYRRSAEIWSRASTEFPDRSDYRFHEAEAMFYAGDEGSALAKMRQLKYEYKEPRAVTFLIDNAVARGDYSAAAVMLAENLDKLSIEKGRSVNRLANIYVKLNRLNHAISLLKRWINYVPRDVWNLLTLASIERDASRFDDAIGTYERILRLNPDVVEAYIGMANSYFGLGDEEKGLEYLSKALAFEPSDPNRILDYAIALYSNGQTRKARQMLLDWVKANENKPVMPILLYHGLTPFDDSPMLGYDIHTSVTSFESQMRGLREAGYEAVTMRDFEDWYDGKETLPEKPVFITFDDARMDGFRYSDPILDQYGFRATMFIPLDDVESFGSIGYANWKKIQEYQSTGRWYFQAHGARAHSKIPVDSRGRKMLYLVMPEWLPSQGRAETEEEWKVRIDEDHQTIIQRLKDKVSTDPIGYAWPEGAYGDRSDSKTAVKNNLAAVKKYFKFAFVQDQYGLNVRTQNSYFMHRIEPPKQWSGKDLVSHLSNQNPLTRFYKQLMHMAIDEKKFSEANQWLAELQELGISENMYLAEKARINYASGRSAQAYQLALQSFTADPTPEVQKMLTDFKSQTGIVWRPNFYYQSDNESRENLMFQQELEIPLRSRISLLGYQARGKFREEGAPKVYESKLGGGLQLGWGDGHILKGALFQDDPSSPANSFMGYYASYWARWTDSLATRLESKRGFHGGARAILGNVRENYYRGTVHYGEKEEWGARAWVRYSDITGDMTVDDPGENDQIQGELKLGMPLFNWFGGVGPVYRYTHMDTEKVDDRYYSPQELNIHELGAQLVAGSKSKYKLTVAYLPGYSKERGRDTRFVQAANTTFTWMVTPNATLSPSYYYEETGAYYYNFSEIELEIRF